MKRALPLLLSIGSLLGCASPTIHHAPVGGFRATPLPPAAPRAPGSAPHDERQSVQLTLGDVVRYALAGNRELQVASFEPARAEHDRGVALAAYDSSLFSTGRLSRTDRPVQSVLDTGEDREGALVEKRWSAQLGIRKPLTTGGGVSIYQQIDKLDTNSTFVFPDPQHTSLIVAQLEQPLLRGILGKEARTAIRTADLGVGISNDQLRTKALDLVEEVAKLYWQIAFEREVLQAIRESLDEATDVHRREAFRRRQGISRDLDVDRAFAAAETRRSDLRRTESRVITLCRRLWLLLNARELPPIRGVSTFVPADAFGHPEAVPEAQDAVEEALANQSDLRAAEKVLEVARLRREVAGHLTLPKLDAKANYTFNTLANELDEALAETYRTQRNSWAMSLELEWPLGGPGGARLRKALVEVEQAATRVNLLREKIADEVVLALAELDLASREIDAARDAKLAVERIALGERARFELMQIGSDDLLRVQEQLAAARRELARARAAYEIALVHVHRVRGTLFERLGIEALRPQERAGGYGRR